MEGEGFIHISELSRKTGVSLRSLRYYEEKGLLKPARLENGYREYDESHIEQVRIIKLYFSLGLTTKEITDFFHCTISHEIQRQCLPIAVEVGERKLEEIKKQIETLRKAESHLEENLSSWREILQKGEGQNE
ncbi:DNA-binding transcriptional MerR regulator [Paenibacillus sp. V4I9]|uniref:MerR family transcriptional regulator n=1 Tax=Paenibacillus sp. V4I9 TaxID=3042308 RepID=UPI00278AEFC9|nr:MerR family transcriptional regulator [Paenibacillus sp. V4I9]MDQ0887829.1 DNA-binding transcriptional MerR regulator [Paenibacillus sp. V4I9]